MARFLKSPSLHLAQSLSLSPKARLFALVPPSPTAAWLRSAPFGFSIASPLRGDQLAPLPSAPSA